MLMRGYCPGSPERVCQSRDSGDGRAQRRAAAPVAGGIENEVPGCDGRKGDNAMYAKIKDEIKQEYYTQNFPNDGQRFVAWYLRNIHLRDMNQAKVEITDGADDKQIDAIFVDDDNSTVYVVQGKFVG